MKIKLRGELLHPKVLIMQVPLPAELWNLRVPWVRNVLSISDRNPFERAVMKWIDCFKFLFQLELGMHVFRSSPHWCPPQHYLGAYRQNFCWMKTNPEAMLQLGLDLKFTEPELSYSRIRSIPPNQFCVVTASASLQKAVVPTLGYIHEACAPAVTSSGDAINGTRGN